MFCNNSRAFIKPKILNHLYKWGEWVTIINYKFGLLLPTSFTSDDTAYHNERLFWCPFLASHTSLRESHVCYRHFPRSNFCWVLTFLFFYIHRIFNTIHLFIIIFPSSFNLKLHPYLEQHGTVCGGNIFVYIHIVPAIIYYQIRIFSIYFGEKEDSVTCLFQI